jgi:hypothetical protein
VVKMVKFTNISEECIYLHNHVIWVYSSE